MPKKKLKKTDRKRLPPDDDSYTYRLVQDAAPPRTRVMKDDLNSRWRFWIRSPPPAEGRWTRRSRSWFCRGNRAAVEELLVWAWGEAEKWGDVCPFEGLLPR